MKLTSTLWAILALCTQLVSAQTWYILEWSAPSGSEFTSLSGEMTIPPLPHAGTYYLWPGLQPTDDTGVLQTVLDGRAGVWWIGSGWCCGDPSLPWGDGFNVYEGDVVAFSHVLSESVWTSNVTLLSTGESVSNGFPITNITMTQVFLAIELDWQNWDFGELSFSNLVMTANTTETSWCTDTPNSEDTVYSVTGAAATVSENVATCNIASAVFEYPSN